MADNTDMSQREKVKAISKAMRESKITKPGWYTYIHYNRMYIYICRIVFVYVLTIVWYDI